MAKALTHSEMAAKLVIEGSLDKISGKTTKKFEIEGQKLSDAQRGGLGRRPGGTTIVYPVEPGGVFIDFHGAATTVWFSEADSSDALAQLEKALKKAYPKTAQREDKVDPKDPYTRHRSYDVPLTKDRAATVDVAYPAPGADARGFVVRILAFAKTETANKKKH
jgi:hypothetical protein